MGFEQDRDRLKILAVGHFKAGKTARQFAAEHHLPRTTVIGWHQRWKSVKEVTRQGRPRKLPPFNESRALAALRAEGRFHDWKRVQDLIREQSGAKLGRRTIVRLFERWDIHAGPSTGRGFRLVASNWVQPEITIHHGAHQRGTLWKLLSKRGLEAFTFTHGEPAADARRVAQALIERVGRSKPRWLRGVLERLQQDSS